MPTATAILVGLAEQFYDDIKFITQQNPTQVVDEDTSRMYNNLLEEVRANFPFSTPVQALASMNARTLKYKDALVAAGQLKRILQLMSSDSRRQSTEGAEVSAPNAAYAPATGPWTPAGRTPVPISPPPRPGQVPAPTEDESVQSDAGDVMPRLNAAPPKATRNPRIQQGAGSDPYAAPPVDLNDDGSVRFSLND